MKQRNEQLLDALSDVGMDLVEETEIRSSFGMNWRRFGSIAACLVLVLGITAAGVKFLPKLVTTTPEPDPTLSQNPDPAPDPGPEVHIPTTPLPDRNEGPAIPENPGDPSAPVYALYDETVQADDGLYKWTCHYYVPQLNFDSPDAQSINDEIREVFGKAVQRDLDAIENNDGVWFTDIDATLYFNEPNILTLVCRKVYAQEYLEHRVYHFDMDTQSRLSNEELLTAVGFDPDEYLTALKQAAASRYLHNAMLWGNFAPGQLFEEDFRWEQYKRTVSDENITLDVPMYVTSGNEGLIVVAFPNIYAIAGADSYSEEVNVLGEKPGWLGTFGTAELDFRTELGNAWTDTMDMTLYWTDPENPDICGAYDTVELRRGWYYERFCVLMDSYTWTEYPDLPPEPGNFWLNLSGNGINWTFWDDGDAGFLMIYDEEGQPQCWKADYIYDTDRESHFTIAQSLRTEYDGAAVDYSRVTVTADGTSEEVAAQIADAYGRWLCSQAPNSYYGATEYAVVSTEVQALGETKWETWMKTYGIQYAGLDEAETDTMIHTILFDMQLAVKPEMDGMRSFLWAGNSYEGEGQWEGWMIFSREVIVQLWPDGQWHITEMGTGGLMLQEE